MELSELHAHWKKGEKKVKWWKREIGDPDINIRRLCKIPLPHPESSVLIAYIYLMHLNYIFERTSCKSAREKILRYRQKVLERIEFYLKKYDIQFKPNDQ